MTALIVCRGCSAAWLDPDCTCECDERSPLYEDWVTVVPLQISKWIAEQRVRYSRVGYSGGVRYALFNDERGEFGGLSLLDLLAALILVVGDDALNEKLCEAVRLLSEKLEQSDNALAAVRAERDTARAENEKWTFWIQQVRTKFRLPDPNPVPDPYWRGYEACLVDVEHRVLGNE